MRKSVLLLAAIFGAFAFAQAQFSIQKVMLEEFTGAWCGWCPDGAVIADQIDNNYSECITVAVHIGDAMENSVGSDLNTFYQPSFPMACVNRDAAPEGRGSWGSHVGNAVQGASSVTVSMDSVTYNIATREVSVIVKAAFTGPESGDMRMNLYFVEDHVTGSGSGYDQVNYLNTQQGHTYYQAGDPIIGFDHRHVMRHAMGGAWGDAGIIPSSVNFGTNAQTTYNYTLPSAWKAEDIHLVAFVSRFDGTGMSDREILNCEEFDLAPLTVGLEEMNGGSNYISVGPNPIKDLAKVYFTIEESGFMTMDVMNTLGQRVATIGEGFMNSGAHMLPWNGRNDMGQQLDNGVYFVRLNTENGQSLTTKVVLAR